MNNLKIGFVGTTQTNFGGGLAGGKEKLFNQSVEALRLLSVKYGFELYVYNEMLVTDGDAIKAKKVLEAEKVDFLLIQNTTFSAGEIIIRLAKINAFIGLWALPEILSDGSVFVDSINSFCGMNMYSSIIANYLKDHSIKYKWFYGSHDSQQFGRRFEITIKALTAIKKLRNSRVALVGGIAPGFNDLYFDERIAQKKLGVEIQRNNEFSEIKERALKYKDSEIVKAKEVTTCGYKCISDASKESLDIHARFYKAYYDFCMDYKYDALGVSCWPKIQDENKCLACSIIGKLNQNGIPAACEGDLPGAVSMLLQKYLTEQPTTLMDMSGFDEDDQTVLMWHCGPSPEYYADSNGSVMTYSRQPSSPTSIKVIGLINDLVFKPQRLTFTRFAGEWDEILILDGKATDKPKKSYKGSRGWIGDLRLNRQEISVKDLVNTILVQGFQHHYPMVAGDITEELLEVAAWLDLKPIQVVGYENYLQNKA